ncbi:hypothetical protein, partial [Sphingomonas bacterium]|uniref:hypothetical protein n=1 Tax=Sphingomonas bacterium TaxID=1895847 RepID=UPI0015773472
MSGLPAWLDDRAALAKAHRASLAVASAWRASEPYQALFARFDALPPGDAEAVAAEAAALFADTAWLTALLAPWMTALAGDDAFEPPLRARRDPLSIGAMLFDHPAVSISATSVSADALTASPVPRTVVVPGRLSVVRYHRAGGARWRQWQAEAIAPGFTVRGAAPCRRLPDQRLGDGM